MLWNAVITPVALDTAEHWLMTTAMLYMGQAVPRVGTSRKPGFASPGDLEPES